MGTTAFRPDIRQAKNSRSGKLIIGFSPGQGRSSLQTICLGRLSQAVSVKCQEGTWFNDDKLWVMGLGRMSLFVLRRTPSRPRNSLIALFDETLLLHSRMNRNQQSSQRKGGRIRRDRGGRTVKVKVNTGTQVERFVLHYHDGRGRNSTTKSARCVCPWVPIG
ncbi:hypothetical protein BDV59DRAFT_63846 [Aspergillus ambiguus]|uniref:uncharacterized protein n=1 Tax=Aspergillus ambiguus TaxID=176160 RepID=UPI003CCCC917